MITKNLLADTAAVSLIAASLLLIFPSGTFAAPKGLTCVISQADTDGKAITRTVGIAFDADANTLTVDDGTQHKDLAHVRISTISVNGYNDEVSIGIERSSWAIVLQTYMPDHSTAEFGTCKLLAASAPQK
jgi:hypothetical protein